MASPARPAFVDGGPYAAPASLEQELQSDDLTIVRVRKNRYDRTSATMLAGGKGLSCRQFGKGHAIHKADWTTAA
jgi:hypothetical protein